MAMINSSVVMIAMPDIFRGIGLDPLEPSNVGYLLWMMLGYLLVTAVFVVPFGRLGDIFGRVRMYNLGFVVFTVGSLLLGLVPGRGAAGAMELIVLRIVQGLGGALLMASSAAILTDAFPTNQRGLALGLNQVAALADAFVGLVVGGLVAPLSWRAVFWVSVPVGAFGAVWSFWKLREIGEPHPAPIDVAGSALFAVGLTAILLAITYAIQPYDGHATAWGSPLVLALLVGGAAVLVAFVVVERRSAAPMMDLRLFRVREFAASTTPPGALPQALASGLHAHGVGEADAQRVASLPPVGTLFAAFLGVNPVAQLLGPDLLRALPPADAQALTGKTFFPQLVAGPFQAGLRLAFGVAIALCVAGAIASLQRETEQRALQRDGGMFRRRAAGAP